MIQRVQSIYLFFAFIAVLGITFYVPVLNYEDDFLMIYDIPFALVTAVICCLLTIFSVFQFKNRKRQLFINQASKLMLSATFFIVFFMRGNYHPYNGLFLFLLPYVLLILANVFIKKDEKLVNSADRIR